MARKLRIEFEGAVYHVKARGHERQAIVLDDKDRECFLSVVGQACDRTGWKVHAFVLMADHYHLVIETPEANLVDGMKWLQNTYTRRFNVRHGFEGPLFGDRYKAVPVETGGTDDYLAALLDYVHLNPARAGSVGPAKGRKSKRPERLRDYRWSSLALAYAVAPSGRESWMKVDRGLELAGCKDTVAGRRRYVAKVERRAEEEPARRQGLTEFEGQSLHSSLRRGWYWGSEAFKKKLQNRLRKPAGPGKKRGERMARQLLKRGREVMEIEQKSFEKWPRGDVRRVALAWAMWKYTTVPLDWIADQLALKSRTNVSEQVRRFEKIPPRELPVAVRKWRREVSKLNT